MLRHAPNAAHDFVFRSEILSQDHPLTTGPVNRQLADHGLTGVNRDTEATGGRDLCQSVRQSIAQIHARGLGSSAPKERANPGSRLGTTIAGHARGERRIVRQALGASRAFAQPAQTGSCGAHVARRSCSGENNFTTTGSGRPVKSPIMSCRT